MHKQLAYKNYLNSVTWKHIREEAVKYYNGKCVKCGNAGVDVHHMFYPEEWGQETIQDLQLLCRDCHKFAHITVRPQKNITKHNSFQPTKEEKYLTAEESRRIQENKNKNKIQSHRQKQKSWQKILAQSNPRLYRKLS